MWDFTAYDPILTERIPASPRDPTVMRWHWDPVHVKRELGDRIIDRLLSRGRDLSLGEILSPGEIESHLDRLERGHLDYVRSRPEELAIIDEAIARLDGTD